MNKKFNFEYILLSVILLFGFLVRLYRIGNPMADWHSWRQADTASVTKTYIQKGINLLYPKYQDVSSIQTGKFNPNGYRMVEFPIYNAIGAILASNFKFLNLEVWSRLLTTFCALVSSFFLYLIGKKYLGKAGGLLSAFFYLFIPFNIYFSRVILPDPMGVAFGLISLWAFIKFIDSKKASFLYLSSAFFGLMMLIKPYLGFYIFPIGYLAVDKFGFRNLFKDKNVLGRLVIFSLISFVPFLVWRAWESRFPEGIPFFTWAFNGDRIRFHPAFWRWVFGERLGYLILGVWGLVPFVFGILRPKVSQFINYFLLGMFFYVTVVASANVRHDYYQILIIPGVSLALSSGTLFLWTNAVFNKILSRTIAIFSISLMLLVGWTHIKDNYQINHPEIIAAGQEVDRIIPKDALVIAPYNGDTAFLYQTNRWGWPAIDDSIDNIVKRGADYYVSVDLESEDTKMITQRFATIEKTSNFVIVDLHKPIKK